MWYYSTASTILIIEHHITQHDFRSTHELFNNYHAINKDFYLRLDVSNILNSDVIFGFFKDWFKMKNLA